jgi:hypothetical protein
VSDAPIEQRVAALQDALIEKGHFYADYMGEVNDWFEHETSPMSGAKVVARAWTDPAYRQRLLADGTAAIAELGISGPEGAHLVVVEKTPRSTTSLCARCAPAIRGRCWARRLIGTCGDRSRPPLAQWPCVRAISRAALQDLFAGRSGARGLNARPLATGQR